MQLSPTIYVTAQDALREAVNRAPAIVAELPDGGFVACSARAPVSGSRPEFMVMTPRVWVALSASAEANLPSAMAELLGEGPTETLRAL
jgi:hypothetical protein